MNLRRPLVIALLVFAAGPPAIAQNSTKAEKPKTPPAAAAKPAEKAADDLSIIRANSEAFVAAFNAGDAKAIAALWTKDGDYTTESGDVFSGREAIEAEYARFFAEHKGLKISLVIDTLRLLSESAAIEDGHASVDPAPKGASGASNYTVVHVKVDGKWLMSTVRDARSASVTVREVDDLEFLIGTWIAEEYGSVMESVCRWVADKSFVERSYTVTSANGTTTSGIQLIGLNPLTGRIQSWNFSSDGGFAVGIWTAQNNGWSAQVQGTTGDGVSTTAVNRLTKLDDNAYSWQSISRSAGGVSLPNTEEIVMKRKSADR